MGLGVAINASNNGNAVDELVGKAKQAASSGVRQFWFGQRFDYDAVAMAGIVGREVPGVEVGTSVVPIFGRHPLLVAGQAQTAQAATGGRYALGLGLGAPAFTESVFGVPFERPVKRLREFITALRSVFETGEADVHGETLTAATPMPARVGGADPVPILVAAMGPQALRATGELADGTLPYLAGPGVLAEHIVPAITRAAESAGRPAPRIVAMAAAVVTSDVEAAKEKAATQMAFYDRVPSYQRVLELGGASRAAELAVLGDEDHVAAEVRRYFDAGATDVVLAQTDLNGTEDQARTWELVGDLSR